jgi:hypothetical protein
LQNVRLFEVGLIHADERTDGNEKSNFHFSLAKVPDISNVCVYIYIYTHTHTGVPGGKVNILGGYNIGHSKQKSLYEHVSYSERFPR